VVWVHRKNPRVSFERPIDTLLMGIDGTWRRDCKLVDISSTGARLIASGSLEGLNLQEFFLLLTASGVAYRRCELVRLDGEEMGVRFLKNRSKPSQGEPERDRPGKPDGAGQKAWLTTFKAR
jgi:PilZ domain